MEKKRNAMQKALGLFLCLVLVLSLAACGGSKPDDKTPDDAKDFVWTREGYFKDEADNLVSIMKSDMEDYPGWYVGVMLGDDMYGWYIPQEGKTLHGNLVPDYEQGEYIVTVTEDGEDGIQVAVEGGDTYRLAAYEMPMATIIVHVNTDGIGGVDYAEGQEAPVFDPDYPYQSAQINLAAPETYTFLATDYVDGWKFVKWTKDGEDLSTEPCITLELDESAEYVAVFEAEN
jgi:hypothetical protein